MKKILTALLCVAMPAMAQTVAMQFSSDRIRPGTPMRILL